MMGKTQKKETRTQERPTTHMILRSSTRKPPPVESSSTEKSAVQSQVTVKSKKNKDSSLGSSKCIVRLKRKLQDEMSASASSSIISSEGRESALTTNSESMITETAQLTLTKNKSEDRFASKPEHNEATAISERLELGINYDFQGPSTSAVLNPSSHHAKNSKVLTITEKSGGDELNNFNNNENRVLTYGNNNKRRMYGIAQGKNNSDEGEAMNSADDVYNNDNSNTKVIMYSDPNEDNLPLSNVNETIPQIMSMIELKQETSVSEDAVMEENEIAPPNQFNLANYNNELVPTIPTCDSFLEQEMARQLNSEIEDELFANPPFNNFELKNEPMEIKLENLEIDDISNDQLSMSLSPIINATMAASTNNTQSLFGERDNNFVDNNNENINQLPVEFNDAEIQHDNNFFDNNNENINQLPIEFNDVETQHYSPPPNTLNMNVESSLIPNIPNRNILCPVNVSTTNLLVNRESNENSNNASSVSGAFQSTVIRTAMRPLCPQNVGTGINFNQHYPIYRNTNQINQNNYNNCANDYNNENNSNYANQNNDNRNNLIHINGINNGVMNSIIVDLNDVNSFNNGAFRVICKPNESANNGTGVFITNKDQTVDVTNDFVYLMRLLPKLNSVPENRKELVQNCIDSIIKVHSETSP